MCFRQVRADTCWVREGWLVIIIPIRSMLLFSHSAVSDSVTSWTAAHQASLYFTISWSLHKFMSIESVILSNHLIPYHPLLLLPSIFPSIRSFPMSQFFALGGQSIGVSASMNVQDWFPTPQFKSINSLALSFLCSPTLTPGKTIALTRWAFIHIIWTVNFQMFKMVLE